VCLFLYLTFGNDGVNRRRNRRQFHGALRFPCTRDDLWHRRCGDLETFKLHVTASTEDIATCRQLSRYSLSRKCQLAWSDASYASCCMIRWPLCRSENANIHGDNPWRCAYSSSYRVRLVPTAVDSLDACVFMLNRPA